MSDDIMLMQHVTKKPASFSHGGESYDSDDTGVIAVPSRLVEFAKAHGFSTDVAEKVLKPLAKVEGDKNKKVGMESEKVGGGK